MVCPLGTAYPPHDSRCALRYWIPPTVLRDSFSHESWYAPHQSWNAATSIMECPYINHGMPPRYWISPTRLKMCPAVLIIPHGAQRFLFIRIMLCPHINHGMPRGTDYPPLNSRCLPTRLLVCPGVHKSEGRIVRFGVIHYNDLSMTKSL